MTSSVGSLRGSCISWHSCCPSCTSSPLSEEWRGEIGARMLDQRGQLLRAALGVVSCSLPSYDRALWALRSYLNCWAGIGRIAVGMARQGHFTSYVTCHDSSAFELGQ